jgi:hypothetical protein
LTAADVFCPANDLLRAVTSVRRAANGRPQPRDTAIPDGDTIGTHRAGSGSVRFLGLDTPEQQFAVPGEEGLSKVVVTRRVPSLNRSESDGTRRVTTTFRRPLKGSTLRAHADFEVRPRAGRMGG